MYYICIVAASQVLFQTDDGSFCQEIVDCISLSNAVDPALHYQLLLIQTPRDHPSSSNYNEQIIQ